MQKAKSTEEPLVSVIIPTFNRAQFIEETINSVVNQTYKNLEIIVVDDHSTDNTCQLINHLHDSRIFYQKNSRTKGAQGARNTGMLNSNGEYILFLDSDDLLLPSKIKKQIDFLISNNFDLVYSPNKHIDEEGNIIGISSNKPPTGTYKDYVDALWQTMCAIYTTKYLNRVGLWQEDLTITQDFQFCLRAVIGGGNIGFLNEPLQLFRCHSGERIGKSINSYEKIKSREKSFISILDLLEKNQKLSKRLKNIYYRRLLHCLLMYGNLNKKDDQKELIKYFNENLTLDIFRIYLAKIFAISNFSNKVIKIHNLIRN